MKNRHREEACFHLHGNVLKISEYEDILYQYQVIRVAEVTLIW